MSAKKEQSKIPPEKIALYDRLVATIPEVERKGVTVPYTSWNGRMFSFLTSDGSLGVRLPKETREQFLKTYNTTLLESYGAVMKEYVAVPEELLQNTQELQPYFAASFEYVKSLKPKPQKKSKTTS